MICAMQKKIWKKGKIRRCSCQNLKSNLISKRRILDRVTQKVKRKYWYSLQQELLNESKSDQQSFWKTIGKIDIASDGKTSIAMEVIDWNGNVSNAVNDVLEKWKSDYSNLLSQQPSNQVHSDVINQLVDQSGNAVTINDFLITGKNSIEEVCNAVNTVKKGKASGVDNIPADVF